MREGCMKYLFLFFVVLGLALVFALIFAYFGVQLWNYAVVPIFGLPEITYWQMFALMVLVRIILMPININYKSKQN